MKILHIVSAKVWGGGEQYVLNLAKCQREHGHDVTICLDSRFPTIAHRFENLSLNLLPVNLSRTHYPQVLWKLAQYVKSQQIDVINFHNGKLSLLVTLLQKLTKTTTFFFKHNIVRGKIDPYHRWITKSFTQTVCVSRAVYEAQLQGLPTDLQEKFCLIHNGIPIPKSVPENHHSQTPSEPLTIGFIGRIVPNKGLQTLLDTSQRLNFDFKLHVAGAIDSTFAQSLKDKYESEKIHFLGFCDDLASFYANVDLIVNPSIVIESFGLVICEAMCFERPVIATNQGGPKEIIRNAIDGLLVEPNNPAALAQALNQIHALSPEDFKQMATSARERVVDCFSIERLYNDLQALYLKYHKN